MFQKQWLVIGAILAAAVIVAIVWDKKTTVALTPTLSFKPNQPATGGVVSNVSGATDGYPGGAGDLDEEFYPD